MSAQSRAGEASFWGSPTLEPKDKDVARFLAKIRDLTKNQGKERSLSLCTSSLKALVSYVAHEHGPREALALLDAMRAETKGAM